MKDIKVVIIIIILCGIIACKKTPTVPEVPDKPDDPVIPTQVTVSATYVNHTEGAIGTKTFTGLSGESLTFKTTDLSFANIASNQITARIVSVDSTRIVVRYAANGGDLGDFIGFSRQGEVTWTYPTQNTDIDIFLMNTSNNAPYEKIDYWIGLGGGELEVPRNASWHREDRDGYTGPDGPPNDATWQLHNALQYTWAKYGSLTKVTSGSDFGVGYGYCNGWLGLHSGTWAGVNPDLVKDNSKRQRVFIAEIVELITRTDDLGGVNTYTLITNTDGSLNAIGRDLFAYVYVKDEKSANTSSRF